MSDDDIETIDRDEAKRIVDEYPFITIIAGDMQPKPTIGDVPPAEREFETAIDTYRVEMPDDGDSL